MHAFIYVFSAEDKTEMERRGYTLLKANELSGQYIFASNGEYAFSDPEIEYVLSDVLTF